MGAVSQAAGAISYSFFIAALDQTISFGTPPNLVGPAYLELTDNGSTQIALLDEALVNPNSGTALTLTGPEGSLFSSVDNVGSLHTGAGVTLESPIVVGERFEGMTTVNLTSQTIPVTGQPIPEPAGWTLLAVCLATLAGVRATFSRQHKNTIAAG